MLRLTVEPLDLGPDVRAVGLELVDSESEEPVAGGEAAGIWSQALAALGPLAMERQVGEQRLGLERGRLGHLLVIVSDVQRAEQEQPQDSH